MARPGQDKIGKVPGGRDDTHGVLRPAEEGSDGHRLLFEAADDGMLVVSNEEKIMDANPAACQLLGRAREDLLGAALDGIFDPSYPWFEAARERLHAGGFTGGARLLRQDGTSFAAEVSLSGSPSEGSLGMIFREAGRNNGELQASAAEYRALVEESLDAMAVFNVNNTWRYANPAIERLLGYTPEELVGTFVPDIVHPEDLARAASEAAELQTTAGAWRPVEGYRYRHKDGHWVYLETLMNNLSENPDVRGVVAIGRDVTERVLAEKALKESENRLRLAVEATGLGIWDYDIATDTLRWDARGKAMLGASPDSEVSFDVFMGGVHPDDRARVERLTERTFDSEEDFHIEYRFVGLEDGVERWIAANGQALFDERDEPYRFVGTVRDITGRKKREQEIQHLNESLERRVEERTAQLRSSMEEAEDSAELLRMSMDLYRTVVEQAAENIFVVDAETKRIVEVNEALRRSLGYSEGELKTMTLYEIVELDRKSVDESVRNIVAGRRFAGERRYRKKDGTFIDVEVSASAISYGDGTAVCIVAHDVTERKRAEEGLRRSLAVLLALYEAGRVLTSVLDLEERGERLLEIMRRVSGLEAAVVSLRNEDREPAPWKATGAAEVWTRARGSREAVSARGRALSGGGAQTFRLRDPGASAVGLCLPLRARGRTIGVLEAFGSEGLSGKDTLDVLTSLADLAGSALENARLYEDLAERERRLEDLVGKLITAQEEERRRVAYDVHDGLAQVAQAAHQHLQVFLDDHPPGAAVEEGELGRVLELVRQTGEEARRVIADLRPTALDDFGLAPAVRLLVDRLREEGWEVEYEDSLGETRLPPSTETALYRVAQESLTNARKHARTNRARVKLERDAGTVRLEVRDFGRGFDLSAAKGGHSGERVGLSGMRERAALLGGELKVESEPGAGTTVIAEVPLRTGEYLG